MIPAGADVREWLAAHPKPTGRQLAEAGYVVPHWPAPFGRDADPLTQLVIDEELRAAGVRRPVNPIGIGWAGPTLLYAGTAEQKERWLWPLLAGEEFWCQLFSEPGAGSDLAALTLRAERDGDHYVINGQKVWTSYAHIAQWGILLARTDPTAAKHAGISYFVCPMRAPGIEVRALVDMTGEHAFNEVFFTDVRIPADHLVGAENGGWELAKVTLGNERVSLSGEGALWGMGPTADDLVVGRCGRRGGRGGRAAGGRWRGSGRRIGVATCGRSRAAGPTGVRVDGEPDSARAAAAHGLGRAGRAVAGGGSVGPQSHRRRPRPARDGTGAGPGGGVRDVAGTAPVAGRGRTGCAGGTRAQRRVRCPGPPPPAPPGPAASCSPRR